MESVKEVNNMLHVKIGDELSAIATLSFILTNVGYMEGETFFEGFSPETGAVFRRAEGECKKTGNYYPEIGKLITSRPVSLFRAG